jgi:circadian clock protein KaiC
MLMGPAGTGKSIIAAQCASAFAARGEKAVLFTLDEGTGTLFKRAGAMRIPLSRHVESGGLVVKQVDPAEISPGEFAHFVRVAVDGGARMVVLDSLNGYYSAMPEESFLSLQLHELFSYLRQQGVIVILTVAQHGILGPMTAPIDVSYLADTVILLRYFEADSRVRKAISVLKQRSGSHETAIRELILEGGLAIGSPLAGFRGIMTGVPVYTNPGSSNRNDAQP